MGHLSLSLAALVQARSDLSPHETLVGLVMAMAVDRRTRTVCLRRATIQTRTRLSAGQLTRALAGLVGKGVLARHRTPRATVYRFLPSPLNGEMDGSLVSNRTSGIFDTVRPPHARIPGYTDEQWEALRVMVRDVEIARRYRAEGNR